MKIRELSIKNCLSFCDKGLNENNYIELGDFNLFIGSNNAGKSNVLKLMKIIKLILLSARQPSAESLQDFPLSLQGETSYFKDWVFAQAINSKMDFSLSLEIERADRTIAEIFDNYDSHRDSGNPVLFMFSFKHDYPKVLKIAGFIEYKQGHPYATVMRVEIPNDHPTYREEPILFDRDNNKILALRPGSFSDEQVWKVLRLYHDKTQWSSDFSLAGNALHSFLTELYDNVFENLLVNIEAIRKIEPVGDQVTEALSRLRDGRQDERKAFSHVQDFINELIFRDVGWGIELSFPGESGSKRIEIAVGDLILPLSHYGSSVEQMLAIATEIVRNGANKVILIEEPEAHFHPDLQRKLLRFLKKNEEIFRHQYLIATHSNIFIDEFINMNGNVFYVHSEQDNETEPKYSQVELFDKEKSPVLFRDLGLRPSDLLLANGILVVEGPTDKDVYQDWARKIERPFEQASILVLDVTGAGNIQKYLLSEVIQRTSFKNYALYDKNAEDTVRKAVEAIVPGENIISLKKGDIEDYYPRKLVLEFAREFAPKKGKTQGEIPDEIKEGETVKKLSELLNGDWWKKNLAEKVINEMKPEQIDNEVKSKLAQIYGADY